MFELSVKQQEDICILLIFTRTVIYKHFVGSMVLNVWLGDISNAAGLLKYSQYSFCNKPNTTNESLLSFFSSSFPLVFISAFDCGVCLKPSCVVPSLNTFSLTNPKKASFLLWLIRVSSSEPSIAVSESVTLPVEGDALTLQCNLTSANDVHQESFWMKNGEEIPDTRSPNKNTEYRSDPQQSLMRQCGRE